MRAKSGQIMCERQKGETTGAKATVMLFAETTTCQSNTNTNHHPAAYCQVSAALNLHIPILMKLSAWSILPWEPGQPKKSSSEAASQKIHPQNHLCCKMLLKKSTSHFLRALSCKSPTSFLPCPQLILNQTKDVRNRCHWSGLMVSGSVQIWKGCTILTRLNWPPQKNLKLQFLDLLFLGLNGTVVNLN